MEGCTKAEQKFLIDTMEEIKGNMDALLESVSLT